MAVKKSQDVTTSTAFTPKTTINEQVVELNQQISTDIEGMIADELLESVDWGMVRTALIEKAKAKFWQWLINGGMPEVIDGSQYPELTSVDQDA